MTDNLRIWDALSKTDPKHTKPFSRAGGFKGTATKPIWLTMRLTEHFGPAGTGWGMDKPEFQTVAAGDEILVFCTVALWYAEGERRATVYGVGGDKVLTKRQSGAFANDEAFKASYTDALSNAMKQIGVAADIHMGLFDDQKYLREVTQEFAAGPAGHATRSLDEARADIAAQTGNSTSTYDLAKQKKAIATLVESAKLALSLCVNKTMVNEWWRENSGALIEGLPEPEFDTVKAMTKKRRDELPELEKAA